MRTQEKRRLNFREACGNHCIPYDDADASYSGGEDAYNALNHDGPLPRYAAITYSGEDSRWAYARPCNTLAHCRRYFESVVDDPIFAETPVEVVDLNTGAVRGVCITVRINATEED